MERRGMGFRFACGAVLLSLLASACTGSKRWNNTIAGAMIGAGIGAAAGTGVGDDNCERGTAAGVGAGIGAVLGGILGYVLTKEEVEAAPAAPAAPRVSAPTPAAPSAPAPTSESKKIVLRGINFDFDKANIKKEFVPVLDEAAQILKDNPKVKVTVEGHTDSKGTDAYNQKLSERRAKAVKQYLVSRGIEANRLDTVGKGEKEPIADNMKNGKDNPEGRAMNRRAELKVQ